MTRGNLSTGSIIRWAVTLGIPLIFFLIPQSEFYTYNVKMFFVVTIFGILLAALELLPVVIIGMLMTGSYIMFKVAPTATVMAPWMGDTLYMVLGGYALASIMDESGLLKRVAYWIMSKTGSNWMGLLIFIFFCGVVLTILTFGKAYIILAALCVGLCKSLDIMKTRQSVAICWACMLGAISAKTFTYCVSMYAVLVNAAQGLLADFHVTFLSAIGHNWPMGLTCFIILLVIGKWYKGDKELNGKDYFVALQKELPPISYREIMAALTLVVIFGLLITESIHHISNNTVFIFVPWLAMLPIFGQDATKIVRSINFDIIFFVAACLSIGTIATSLGFGQLIAQYAVPFFNSTGNNPFVVFAGIFFIVFLEFLNDANGYLGVIYGACYSDCTGFRH